MEHFIKIISKPDNVAIVIMMFLVAFYTVWAFQQAVKNDRRKKRNEPVEGEGDLKVSTWPYLARVEFICAIIVTIFLIVWSVLLNAPLEEHSNPALTPNPAKAPWYFLGLQEILVYFDPWIAGVVVPSLMVLGLMAIPYLDINPKGNGYYTFSERKYSIIIFSFGFHILWILLIVIGVFMRGPGWLWFWPWQEWDHSRVVYMPNVDLTNVFGIDSRSFLGSSLAGLLVLGYFAVGTYLPYNYWKRKHPQFLEKLGLTRLIIIMFLLLSMIGITIKIFLRLVFYIKYIWVTPWFSI